GFSVRKTRLLLWAAAGLPSLGARVELLSGLLLGLPYRAEPLGGGPDAREVLDASLDGFDCVTYVETVLALSRSARAEDLASWLRRVRYDGGRVEWRHRHHYMTGWLRANARAGLVRSVAPRGLAASRERLLDCVPGLPPRRVRFSCVPKARLPRLARHLATGDVVLFASTRRHLDVFHCGILVGTEGGWRLRHAARSRGSVVEQELDDFLRANRMAGLVVARPVDAPPGAPA
ncbi:DUF1460 domain-containing protein, partial [Acidobacteria bacterium ACD]|nr:DUF1460 domain-containing protein [Acidobacteria bacterium ACD]